MKAIFLSILLSFVLATTQSVEWLHPKTHDFGDIPYGREVSHSFSFKNISQKALTIDNVRASCGCTTPNWSAMPIFPDSTSSIVIKYDAADPGFFQKKIKVYFHKQRKAELLYIEGYVIEN